MAGTVRARHLRGDRFEIDVRKHVLHVDQPTEDGGDDTAPTPTELFVAALTSCVGHYAHRYLVRHGLPADPLSVTARFEMASRPARVGAIDLRITVPDDVPADRREALLAVATHCTVHNTLTWPPAIRVTLDEDGAGDGLRATA